MNFLSELNKISSKKNIITRAHWEIISNCNLKCKHCYIDDKKQKISLENALNIIKYLKKAGIFYVILSGGETLLHPNFKEIYLELKKAGMTVTVFTNGTLINDEIIKLFNEFKPYDLEISIYGADEISFEKFTDKKNLYEKFVNNLRLLSINQNIKIKIPLTKSIHPYLNQIKILCSELDIPFSISKYIYPSLNGSAHTLKERLSTNSLVKYEFKEEQYGLSHFKQNLNKQGFSKKSKLECSASKNIIVINPDMSLSFCGMMREPKEYFFDYKSFMQAKSNMQNFRLKVEGYYNQSECSNCVYANLCSGCPALSLTHNNSYTSCISYFKQYIEEKLSYLTQEELSEITFKTLDTKN